MKFFCKTALLMALAFVFANCNTDTFSPNSDDLSISEGSKKIEINVDKNLTKNEPSPSLVFEYSALTLRGDSLLNIKMFYPTTKRFGDPSREFNVSVNDSFSVEIKKCNKENDWYADLGEMPYGGSPWTNTDISLMRTEKNFNNDGSYNCKFVYKVMNPGKGYIAFIEKTKTGAVQSSSRGVFIGYNANPLNKVYVNFEEVKWLYNTISGSFSTVSVKIKGTTNAYRLRCRTSGDGLLSAAEVPVNNGRFDDTINIAFSHVSGLILTTSSELAVYGTVGLPKLISLINPKGKKE